MEYYGHDDVTEDGNNEHDDVTEDGNNYRGNTNTSYLVEAKGYLRGASAVRVHQH